MNKKFLGVIIILVFVTAIGGYFTWRHFHGTVSQDAHNHSEKEVVQYTCPMHPFIIKDKPGTCPICGMELVKKGAETQADSKELAALGHVSLSPTQQVIANTATIEAKVMSLAKDVNAVGLVQYDQSRQGKVTAWVAGRIDRLHVNTVGAWVSKGKAVAEVYSPDLVSAQQEYLLALKSREQFKNSPIPSIAQGGESLVASSRQRLKLLGIKDHQIEQLEKAGSPILRIDIYTPLSGIVIEKMVQEGQYVNVGEPLFSVADLSTVWVEAEVYENEFPFVKVGQRVEIESQSYPGKTFTGQVTFIYPFLDPKTRTVKARITIPNPDMKLKPEMFVTVHIKAPLGNALTIPVTALMDTGKRQVVWIEGKPGVFVPRDVKIGARVDDKVQIMSGLKAGERIAVSGGYLIDSESQLRSGTEADHSQQEGAAPTKNQGSTAPASKKKDDMRMDDMKM